MPTPNRGAPAPKRQTNERAFRAAERAARALVWVRICLDNGDANGAESWLRFAEMANRRAEERRKIPVVCKTPNRAVIRTVLAEVR